MIKLYRVYNKTKQRYERRNSSNTTFYYNETGVKLGLRRMQQLHRKSEFEVHEYIAIPVAEYESLFEGTDDRRVLEGCDTSRGL